MRTILLPATVVALVVFTGATLALPAPAQVGETCGVTVYSDGQPVWIPLPCGALTPWATVTPMATATATPTATPASSATPTNAPTATRTPFPTPTPEVFTPTPTPDYTLVAQPCYLKTDSSGATNVRSAPYGTVITQLPPDTLFAAPGYVLDGDENMWVRRLPGGYVARWVLIYHSGCEGSDIPGGP